MHSAEISLNYQIKKAVPKNMLQKHTNVQKLPSLISRAAVLIISFVVKLFKDTSKKSFTSFETFCRVCSC